MKHIIFLIMFSSVISVAGPVFCETRTPTAQIIPVSGEVGPAMAAFIKRAVRQAKEKNPDLIIFEIDTFGGRVDSALDIVDTLLTIDKEVSVSYVNNNAISAGALIALASGRLYMKNGSTLGDCAPISYSKDGVEEMGEKFQSPLRARFRALAKRNGFPQDLAESMVSKDREIIQASIEEQVHYFDKERFNELNPDEKSRYHSIKTVVKKGELLTIDDVEAVNFTFSKASVAGSDELFALLGIDKAQVNTFKRTWSEIISGILITVSPLLMMIGLAAIYMEFKSPGFGIAGAIGITCLALALSSQYMAGMTDYVELLIIVAGIFCLAIEIFVIPGFGIAGILGILLIFSGMVLSLQEFTLPSPELPWQMDIFIRNIMVVLGICIFSMLLSILAFRYLLPHLPVAGSGSFLRTTLKESHADSFESMKIRVGDFGIALSFLRPSGKADFNGNRVDVISEGTFINKGDRIEVIEVTKNKVVVEKKEA